MVEEAVLVEAVLVEAVLLEAGGWCCVVSGSPATTLLNEPVASSSPSSRSFSVISDHGADVACSSAPPRDRGGSGGGWAVRNVGGSFQTRPEHVVAPMAHGPPTRTAHGSHRLVVVLLNA